MEPGSPHSAHSLLSPPRRALLRGNSWEKVAKVSWTCEETVRQLLHTLHSPAVQAQAHGVSHLQSSPLDGPSRLGRDQQLKDTWSGTVRVGCPWVLRKSLHNGSIPTTMSNRVTS